MNTVKLISDLSNLYCEIKLQITDRLQEFDLLLKRGSDIDIFKELIFCILTPQSKAKVCWQVVQQLEANSLLVKPKLYSIQQILLPVRFRLTKARYIIELQKQFVRKGRIEVRPLVCRFRYNNLEFREWLVKNVKGLGYKEASHFLRNIGLGKEIAILDRHILKNLQIFGVIDKIPKSLSKKNYLEIEHKMQLFANKINISMEELDFLLWYKQTGYIFK